MAEAIPPESINEEIELLPAINSKQPGKRGRRPGEGGRPVDRLNKDIRETIKHAFYAAGGKRYLVEVAHKRPDVFLTLLGRSMPTETKVSLMASYQGIPVTVEDRDSPTLIAAPVPSPSVLEGIAHEVTRQDAADAAMLMPGDDWLEIGHVSPAHDSN